HRLSGPLFQDIDRFFIGRQYRPWNSIESDQRVERAALDNGGNPAASFGRAERQEPIQPAGRKLVQFSMPRCYKGDIHNVGRVRAKLADIARASDMDDIGFERAKSFG